MASNSSCGCMGTLRYVSGPHRHCPMPPARPEDYINFPFYNGPCPPCRCESGCGCKKCCRKNCGCGHCGGSCNSCSSCSQAKCRAGMFAADAPFCVSAGEAIPMDAKLVGGDCFEVCDGCIRIHKAGIYYAVWTLNVPSYRNLCSRLYLTLNGNEVAGSSQTICCQADNTSTSVTGQALISVPTGGVVCLVSESAMCLDGSCNVENVATLSIRRAE